MTLDIERLVTAAEACNHLRTHGQRITQRMISDWRRAGHLDVARYKQAGQTKRPLYRLGQVMEIEAKMRMSGQSHRKPLIAA